MNHLNGKNEEDRRIYERSARLILLLALRDIAPGAKARFEHSIGLGLYLNVSGVSLTASLVRKIEARMREISKADLLIVKSRWTREQAVAYFRAQGQEDTVRLLAYRPFDHFDVYTCDGLSEYFYGDMVESTGEIQSFALRFYYPGMVLLLPAEALDGAPAPFVERPKLMRAYVEANVCSRILQCENAADLNDIIAKGDARTFIRVSEAMQERAVAQIAERIVANGARVVFIAGPSSSGKTTFANRLSVQLRVSGKRPLAISLDNYYKNREMIPLGADGKPGVSYDAADWPASVLYSSDEGLYMQNINVTDARLYGPDGETVWNEDVNETLGLWPDKTVSDIDYVCTRVVHDTPYSRFRIDLDMNRAE